MMKRPAFQFYPDKWQSDKDLRRCSIGARGLWLEVCCVMHTCSPYGHLTTNTGEAMPDADVARLCGVDRSVYRKLLAELEEKGVPSRTRSGVVYSRRMVRDESARNARAVGGHLGAEHGHKGAEHGAKGGRKQSTRGDDNPPRDSRNDHGRGVKEPPSEPPPVVVSASAINGVQIPGTDAHATGETSTPSGDKSPMKINGESHPAPGWWRTSAGILAEGKRQGKPPRVKETEPEYKARLFHDLYPGEAVPTEG